MLPYMGVESVCLHSSHLIREITAGDGRELAHLPNFSAVNGVDPTTV
jgi:hypothetical protein